MTNIKFSLGSLWCFVYILRDVTSNELRTDAVFLPFFEHKNCFNLQKPRVPKVVGNAVNAFFMKCGLSVSWSTSLNCDTVSNINVTFPKFPCPTIEKDFQLSHHIFTFNFTACSTSNHLDTLRLAGRRNGTLAVGRVVDVIGLRPCTEDLALDRLQQVTLHRPYLILLLYKESHVTYFI